MHPTRASRIPKRYANQPQVKSPTTSHYSHFCFYPPRNVNEIPNTIYTLHCFLLEKPFYMNALQGMRKVTIKTMTKATNKPSMLKVRLFFREKTHKNIIYSLPEGPSCWKFQMSKIRPIGRTVGWCQDEKCIELFLEGYGTFRKHTLSPSTKRKGKHRDTWEGHFRLLPLLSMIPCWKIPRNAEGAGTALLNLHLWTPFWEWHQILPSRSDLLLKTLRCSEPQRIYHTSNYTLNSKFKQRLNTWREENWSHPSIAARARPPNKQKLILSWICLISHSSVTGTRKVPLIVPTWKSPQ